MPQQEENKNEAVPQMEETKPSQEGAVPQHDAVPQAETETVPQEETVPQQKLHITFRLSKEAIASIDAYQQEHKLQSRTEALEEILLDAEAFRTTLKEKPSPKPLPPDHCNYDGKCGYRTEDGKCSFKKPCPSKGVAPEKKDFL